MSASVAPPRSSRPVQPTKRLTIADISMAGSGLPNRYVIHGVEGWGKTSLAANMPKPIFIQTRGETGLETLIDARQISNTAHFPEISQWDDLIAALEEMVSASHDFKVIAIDTANGCERLCHEHVCHHDFGDDWGERGFASYGKGPEIAMVQWRRFLGLLDQIRSERKMSVVMLCHTKVATFRNPEGADFDRYQPDLHKTTWSLTHKWADVVLFGNFETDTTSVKENKRTGEKKGKGVGGSHRVLFTQRTAAYDAKNRLGLPESIDMGGSPAEGWQNLMTAIKEGRKLVEGGNQ